MNANTTVIANHSILCVNEVRLVYSFIEISTRFENY